MKKRKKKKKERKKPQGKNVMACPIPYGGHKKVRQMTKHINNKLNENVKQLKNSHECPFIQDNQASGNIHPSLSILVTVVH